MGKIINSISFYHIMPANLLQGSSAWENLYFVITDYLLPKSKNLILNVGHSSQSVLRRTVLSSAAVLVSVTWVRKGFPITSWKNNLTYKFWKISQYSISPSPIWKKLFQEKMHHKNKKEAFHSEDHCSHPWFTLF